MPETTDATAASSGESTRDRSHRVRGQLGRCRRQDRRGSADRLGLDGRRVRTFVGRRRQSRACWPSPTAGAGVRRMPTDRSGMAARRMCGRCWRRWACSSSAVHCRCGTESPNCFTGSPKHQDYLVAYVVLAIAFALESVSLLQAVAAVARRSAPVRPRPARSRARDVGPDDAGGFRRRRCGADRNCVGHSWELVCIS